MMLSKPKALLFIFLMMFAGFCAGMFTGSFFVPPGSGLAGPAIAFMYGVGGMVIGLAAGIWLAKKLAENTLKIWLIVLVIISSGIIIWFIYRVITLNQRNAVGKNLQHQQTDDNIYHFASSPVCDKSISEGMAKPQLVHVRKFYFYYPPSIGEDPGGLKPFDSLLMR